MQSPCCGTWVGHLASNWDVCVRSCEWSENIALQEEWCSVCWLDIWCAKFFNNSILSALQQSWFVLHLWTACLSVAQIASSLWRWYRLELSLDSIRHEVVAGMAGAKSLLLFRTLLGPRKVLSQLGDLSIDSILCWSLWFDGASKDLRLLVDDRCGVFRATTAWSTCGLSSGYDYGTRTSGAPFSPTCPDFVQGWTQDHFGLVQHVCTLFSATSLLRPSQKGGREAEGPGGVSKGYTGTHGTGTMFGGRWGGRGTWH